MERQRYDDVELNRVATSVTDTPQTVSTVSRAELAERGIASLSGALRSVERLTLGAG